MVLTPRQTVVCLSWCVALLAVLAASIGLFALGGPGPQAVTTLGGEAIEIYGTGLYRHDSNFVGAGYRALDAVKLVLGVPLLLACTVAYRRGSLRGAVLLLGLLAYFLYDYASMALGATYNELFLVYVALFSASLFAFVTLFSSIDLRGAAARLPRVGPATFLFVSGVVTFVVWTTPLVGALVEGRPPALPDGSITTVTDALDLAVLVPAMFIGAVLVLKRDLIGYRIAFALFGIVILLAPGILASTVSQRQAGVLFTTAEIVGPVCGFTLLGLVAIGVVAAMLRRLPVDVPRKTGMPKAA